MLHHTTVDRDDTGKEANTTLWQKYYDYYEY